MAPSMEQTPVCVPVPAVFDNVNHGVTVPCRFRSRRIRLEVALLLLRRMPLFEHPAFTEEKRRAAIRHCELFPLPAGAKGTVGARAYLSPFAALL